MNNPVAVERELLERIASDDEGVASLADFEELKRVLAQPAEAGGVEVVAWMHTHYCDLLTDAPERRDEWLAEGVELVSLVLQSDHLAALSAVTAERDRLREALQAEQDRYQRDVYGLNNEGDPIGGEPAGGYANDNARLRAEVEALRTKLAENTPS